MTNLNNDAPEITVTETISKKAPKANYSYPFKTKKQVAAQLAVDDGYVLSCFDHLVSLQAQVELERATTFLSNKKGWMCSHTVAASKLMAKKAEGTLDSNDMEKMRGMTLRYTKQLASWEMTMKIAENPGLAINVEIFSCKPE